jgi:hypothetical protein
MTQVGDSIATIGALLLGRRTYEDFYAVWPKRKENPLSAMLDAMNRLKKAGVFPASEC